MHEITSKADAETAIRTLAERHGVVYEPVKSDLLGGHITRLAGDDVALDSTELLLLALERAGHVQGVEAVRLHAAYLHQKDQDVRPVR
ncbi:MAG: hypothetical protein P4M15_12750 [Alphaproteobacteria bacterium]|nr:hypothetical protein [Alphaproteobacteria bacterium]